MKLDEEKQLEKYLELSKNSKLHDIVSGWYVGKALNTSLKLKKEPTEELLNKFEKLQKSTQTTLSGTVQNFLIFDHDENNKDFDKFLTKDKIPLLNFEELTIEKLTSGLTEEELKDETKMFIKAGDYMKNVTNVVHNYFINTIKDEEQFKLYEDYFELFDEKKNEIILSTLKYHIIEKNSMFAFQFLVPFIERNLQNILFGVRLYKLKKNKKKIDFEKMEEEIPTKISEFLSNSEIIDLFGKDIIFLLKLLIGPLHGINLRNITLHGFMTTNEWFNGFTSLILMLIFSISPICKNLRKNFEINFQQRPFEKCVHKYKKKMLNFKDFDISILDEFLNRSLFIIPNVKDQWKKSFEFFKKNEFYNCLVYLFPLIEHSIRRIYVCSNENSVDRLLTAEQHSLYTTLDILLTEQMTFSENKEEKNQIFKEIGIQFQNICWDIFLWEECPRIRDLISHGGIDPFIQEEMKEISNFILSFSLAFIIKYDVQNIENQNEIYIKKLPEILKESFNFFESEYIPIYHPKHVVQKSILKSKKNLEEFEIKIEFPELLESKYTIKIMEDLKNDIDLVGNSLNFFKIEIGELKLRSNDLTNKNQLIIFGVILTEKEYKKSIKLNEILKSCDENLKLLKEHHQFLWNIIVDKKSTTQHRKHFGQLISYFDLFLKFYKFSIEIVEAEFNHQENQDQEFLTKIYNCVTGMEASLKTRKFRQAFEIIASFLLDDAFQKIKFIVLHKKFVERNFGEVEKFEYLKK